MISRVAEHCFWLSRYLERAENTARMLDVNQILLLDYEVPHDQQWRPLLVVCGVYDMPGEAEAEAVQNYMTWESANASSIVSSISAARENARIIREVISAEMWERMNYYHLWLQSNVARQMYETSRSDFYGQIRRINQLIHGIADGTMSDGEGWEFFQLGKYLERASQTARFLDVKYHILLPTPEHVGSLADNAQWIAILTSCSGYEPFHKKVPVSGDLGTAVAEFLVLDPRFPRSVRCCVSRCQFAAHAISGRPPGEPDNDVERQLADLTGWLNDTSIQEIIRGGLHQMLTRVVDTTHEIGNAVHRTYFDVRVPSRLSVCSETPENAGANS
jgi:uncharacterized alpha-E superfamily protein